jgi:phosphate transport system protein
MLHDSLNTFARMDVDEAVKVASRDPEIDQEFDALGRLLITHMMEDPRDIKNVLNLNWCARSLERVGDHASNICEYVIYLVKGMDVRHISLEQIQEALGIHE